MPIDTETGIIYRQEDEEEFMKWKENNPQSYENMKPVQGEFKQIPQDVVNKKISNLPTDQNGRN